jgi:putative tryptophan/tyrosine transport system substrate-binding protein
MKHKAALVLVLALLAAPPAAGAQQAGKVHRVGVLCATFCPSSSFELPEYKAFLDALRGLGWVDGQSVVVDDRAAGVGFGWLGEAVARLVQLKVDVILAIEGAAAAQAARHATGTIPIVLVGVPDAVGLGLVASLARPGGNITGLTVPMAELAAKQLELLKDLIPSLSRVALLSNPDNPDHPPVVQSAQAAAQQVRVSLTSLQARRHNDLDGVLSAVSREGAGALLVLPDQEISGARAGGRLTLLALQRRVPTISLYREFPVRGGLMSYGPSLPETYRRAARFVDRILRGTRPADLPVEQPLRYDLVVNLNTARSLGLTIPPSVLVRADEVIQ